MKSDSGSVVYNLLCSHSGSHQVMDFGRCRKTAPASHGHKIIPAKMMKKMAQNETVRMTDNCEADNGSVRTPESS